MGKTGAKTEAGIMAVTANVAGNNLWTQNPDAVHAIEVAKRMRNTKHGLYANVPILCKAEACPYAHTCPLLKMQIAPFGEPCPMEIAAIEDLFERYCTELMVDPGDPAQSIDASQIREVVDIDISLLRCDKKMAVDADFIIQNAIGMTEDGDAITKSELHPAIEYKEKLRNTKLKILQSLNSTRKDKIGSKTTVVFDASERAAQLLKVQKESKLLDDQEDEAERRYFERINGSKVIDVEPIGFEEENV